MDTPSTIRNTSNAVTAKCFLYDLAPNAAMETKLSLILFGAMRMGKQHYVFTLYGLSEFCKNIFMLLYSFVMY